MNVSLLSIFLTLKVGVKESRGRAAGLCGSALQ